MKLLAPEYPSVRLTKAELADFLTTFNTPKPTRSVTREGTKFFTTHTFDYVDGTSLIMKTALPQLTVKRKGDYIYFGKEIV